MPTKIEWCQETWNPITGCTPISEGCQHCYAARMAKRLAGRFGYPKDNPFKPGIFHSRQYAKPASWRKPRMIFVCSMGDLFHQDVPGHLINKIFAMMLHPMSGADHHTYLLLTKRPERILQAAHPERFKGRPNIWLGVTAENQNRHDERWESLKKIPAHTRFLSIEPMLEPVELTPECISRPDWVICGPETGPIARPFNYDWARALRDQCQRMDIPFFYKKHDHPDTPEDLKIKEFPQGAKATI